MNKKIIMFVLTVLCLKSMAQTTEPNILGYAQDAKNAPVEYATVSLMNAADSTILKMAISDEAGKFSFEKIPFGSYFIQINSIGLAPAHTPAFRLEENKKVVVLDAIVLRELSVELAGVVITAKRPLIEQKIDRLVVNVDASVTNMGATALEVLEKSPGVTVSKDGVISLKGKSAVQVMIDGKPSYLSNAELSNLLGSMSANELNQIEIMTNPSAKYDASGNAGVINIKTKKSLTQGMNGSVTLGYGQGVYAKSNNSIMLNYRLDRWNAFLNYGYNLNNSFMNFDIQRNFFDLNDVKLSELDQQSNRKNHNQNNNLKLGLDYFVNSRTTIGAVASGFFTPQNQDGFTTSYLSNGNGVVTSLEKTTRTVDNTWKNGALNLNLHSSSDSTKKDFSANIDYLHYDFSGNQKIEGLTFSPEQILEASLIRENILPLTIDIYSGRFDYAQPLKHEVELETGIKSSLVKTNNVSNFYYNVNGQLQPDSAFSNAFNYTENINAAYVNLNKQMGKWKVQAGLRLENTHYEGVQSALSEKQDSTFSRNYTSLFPTAFARYAINDVHQLGLSVGRRIDRPEYQQLNPFIGFIDKYTYSSGNPFLQPQISNNVELSHTYKDHFTTTLNFSVVKDMINETLIHADSVIIRSVGNIGTRYNYGIAESAAFDVGKWYSGSLFANLYQNNYTGVINGFPFKASQLSLLLNVNNQFRFVNGWSAEISGTYTSRNRDEGQAIILPAGQLAAGISKQIFDNRASLKCSIRDIFYTQNPKEIQNFQDVQSTLRISRDTRVFSGAFVYRFGVTMKSKTPRTLPTEEQQRVKTY